MKLLTYPRPFTDPTSASSVPNYSSRPQPGTARQVVAAFWLAMGPPTRAFRDLGGESLIRAEKPPYKPILAVLEGPGALAGSERLPGKAIDAGGGWPKMVAS